ncbi:MAG: thiolase family protein [Thermoleophilia bacterium]|jgi:acetyl-CoA C-acetyltransferase|nr:thiolase family protein [Thermoleophilia bacterium]
MARTVLVSAARTPFCRLSGDLAGASAVDLGVAAAAAAIERSGLTGADVDYSFIGTVVQAGQMHAMARQVTTRIGIPVESGSETINKVCASGMRAIALADYLIRLDEAAVVLAGGMESMTSAPYLALGARQGFRFGDTQLVDADLHDGLRDPWTQRVMYDQANEVSHELGLMREELDAWALRSHQRAVVAQSDGSFAAEIAPVTIRERKQERVVDQDQGPRADSTLESLAKLGPLTEGGTHTAGNSPGVTDGAAMVIAVSEEVAVQRGLKPLAIVRSSATAADITRRLACAPSTAVESALAKAGLSLADIDMLEVNEAFASIALNTIKTLGIDPDRVNCLGGAVALGHPVGASGARLVGTLVHQLGRAGGGIGVATICSGGGQGDAMVLEVLPA